MSVRLTPINSPTEEEREEHTTTISNGEWLALTAFANAFGEEVPKWNACHDPVRYTPEQLRAIATRLQQVLESNTIPWLLDLADQGGAELS